ncbi:hypothetical protein GCM10010270_78520 [Streptomyces violaceus]|nr:hypothetical protein GCM10010270_78520 [Streptomyces janthinus]
MATDNRYEEVRLPGVRHTAMGWPVTPATFTDLLVGLKERYGDVLPPLPITENGSAEDDEVSADGAVHDSDRVACLRDLTALRAAMDTGVDVRGYYVWSLLDNFERAFGYDERIGIVRVGYATQQTSSATNSDIAVTPTVGGSHLVVRSGAPAPRGWHRPTPAP